MKQKRRTGSGWLVCFYLRQRRERKMRFQDDDEGWVVFLGRTWSQEKVTQVRQRPNCCRGKGKEERKRGGRPFCYLCSSAYLPATRSKRKVHTNKVKKLFQTHTETREREGKMTVGGFFPASVSASDNRTGCLAISRRSSRSTPFSSFLVGFGKLSSRYAFRPLFIRPQRTAFVCAQRRNVPPLNRPREGARSPSITRPTIKSVTDEI
jgi:hypothetical protein